MALSFSSAIVQSENTSLRPWIDRLSRKLFCFSERNHFSGAAKNTSTRRLKHHFCHVFPPFPPPPPFSSRHYFPFTIPHRTTRTNHRKYTTLIDQGPLFFLLFVPLSFSATFYLNRTQSSLLILFHFFCPSSHTLFPSPSLHRVIQT